ncbi:MAG: hypothetical protein BJ554DRAFT_5672 [Olpidium bornovanus]|uniref:Helicase ATP-binding domain-containing protein n=1 Tax=Olpidium bornovanus TaxID=278681 RepID=A0A8H7ZZ86_9FUNG|nr:MAG: hypothetical protein BJ554DRAFT_5672 [Olpidium bornovanus]
MRATGTQSYQPQQQSQRDGGRRTRAHTMRKARPAEHPSQPLLQPEITASFRRQHARSPLQDSGARVARRRSIAKAAENSGVPVPESAARSFSRAPFDAERCTEAERKRKRAELSFSSSSSSPTLLHPSSFEQLPTHKASAYRSQRDEPITSSIIFGCNAPIINEQASELPATPGAVCTTLSHGTETEAFLKPAQDAFKTPVATSARLRVSGVAPASAPAPSPFSTESAFSMSPYSPGFMADVAVLLDRVEKDGPQRDQISVLATPTRRPAPAGLPVEPLQAQDGRSRLPAYAVRAEDRSATLSAEAERGDSPAYFDDDATTDDGQEMVPTAMDSDNSTNSRPPFEVEPSEVSSISAGEMDTKPGNDAILSAVPDEKLESRNLLLSSAYWDLPPAVVESYKTLGMEEMYPWQAECLSLEGVLDGNRNLVYSAPTSAGKTFVADMVVLKKVLLSRKKALMILPYVSVVSEKTEHLQQAFRGAMLRVEGYFAGNSSSNFDNVDIGVCTIEKVRCLHVIAYNSESYIIIEIKLPWRVREMLAKVISLPSVLQANGLVNRLLEENCLEELGIVVIDELHVIGRFLGWFSVHLLFCVADAVSSGHALTTKSRVWPGEESRGYLLELLLTKLRVVLRDNVQVGDAKS